MGSRGPAKTPTKLRVLEGNPSRRPLPRSEPEPAGAPAKPDYLGDYASALWDVIVDSMRGARIYAALDTELLAAYCVAAELHREAVEKIRSEGATAKGAQGQPVVSPWVTIKNSQAQIMRSNGRDLGIGPAARASLGAAADGARRSGADDPDDGLLRG